ncbi:RAMP superfamily CRISPR-associated protein [Microcoleus sp. FACHB-68]|uniref:RAMP superfamily CRISPR-associated protein n=1 Tax=Microcoleus sp. FACHB-68 TaxID=2692826 RepID=UPI00168676DF|nr:RAMP superfamily CRISPR-associated protein [Microcoleus sp. FACHB-68]MBD1937282.1 hypothetical protein [Microcoleus sp. FACHB-68]
MSSKPNKLANSADIWRAFITAEQKINSKLGKIFAAATYGGYDRPVLTLYFADEAAEKAARGQIQPLKNKLSSQLFCEQVVCRTGTAPPPAASNQGRSESINPVKNQGNPLQALNFAEFKEVKGKEIVQPVLESAVGAEKDCAGIYTKLCERTLALAGGKDNTLTISFSWRMRVGGTRGFRELLLPAFHPVFGVPYIPASSLKGAAKHWAKSHHPDQSEVTELLGMLVGKTVKAAKIIFLDAFPTKPCLSVDVATPQWVWNNQHEVKYKPEPHALLSLEQPQFLIGLQATSPQYADKIELVKTWLKNALDTGGLGSRISGGYGRTISQEPQLPHSKNFNFELWTQGIYGGDQQKPEFRPTALRGILRYWFRAVALGLYDAENCLKLEEKLFGNLGQPGQILISTRTNPPAQTNPYCYTGTIYLEASEKRYLNLVEQLLILASHLGGVGRGSRRPLHLLNGRMRGCHWTLDRADLPFEFDLEQWKGFFKQLIEVFKTVETPIGSYTSSPGEPGSRRQDVLDKNAQVWLLKSSAQVSPKKVKNWQTEGNQDNVRGSALSLLYGDTCFKGENQEKQGNSNVGGKLGTPSFVWIKSIFPAGTSPYQVVTLFGVDDKARLKFAEALQNIGANLIFGEMPSSDSSHRPKLKRK